MRKTLIAVLIIIAFSLMIGHQAFAKADSIENLSKNAKVQKLGNSIGAHNAKMLNEMTKKDKATLRGESSTKYLFFIGNQFGLLRFLYIEVGLLEKKEDIKRAQDIVDGMKEAGLKLGMPAGITASYDELKDLIGGGKANLNAISEKHRAILSEILKWIDTDLGKDKEAYLELGFYCGYQGTIARAAIVIPNVRDTLTKMLVESKKYYDNLTTLLKDDESLPTAAKKSFASIGDLLKDLTEKGSDENTFKKMDKAFENIISAIQALS